MESCSTVGGCVIGGYNRCTVSRLWLESYGDAYGIRYVIKLPDFVFWDLLYAIKLPDFVYQLEGTDEISFAHTYGKRYRVHGIQYIDCMYFGRPKSSIIFIGTTHILVYYSL
jgi:hypothetical protein